MIREHIYSLPDSIVGTPIWAFDWDICCVLDGCRVDTFREFYPDAGEYWSQGGQSKDWIRRTFDDRPDERVGYISANPFSSGLVDELEYFHQEPVVETEYGIETVPPETLTEHAIAAWRQCDIDRLVVHYMQPHVPFRSKPGWFIDFHGTDTWGAVAWERCADDIERVRWMDAYRDNLRWVLESGIDPLSQSVDAELMLTADHGNSAGEWGVYGHTDHMCIPEVRKVPKQFITAECEVERGMEAVEPKAWDDEQQKEQLRALGYR